MGAFDEMIGLDAEVQLTRRPLASLGQVDEEQDDEIEEAEGDEPAHGQRAPENDMGDPNDSFINKLLASKFGHDVQHAPDGAAKRTSKPC